MLGNPLVEGALRRFGTDAQREDLPPPDRTRRPHLDPALQRARRRERPRVAVDAGPARRRPLRRRRPEGVEHVGPVRGLRVSPGPERARTGPGGRHRLHPRHAQPGDHDAAAPRDDRHDRLQRGLPRCRARPSGECDRRARGRLAGRGPRASRRSAVVSAAVAAAMPSRASYRSRGGTAGGIGARSTIPPSVTTSPGSRRGRGSSARSATRSRRRRRQATARHGTHPSTKIWFSELNLEMAEYAMALQGPVGALVEGESLADEDGRWQDASSTRGRGRSPVGPTRSCGT